MDVDLIGEVVEERGLNNCENIEELITKFVKPTSLNHLKPLFEKEIGPKINSIKKEKRDIVLNLLSEIPLNSQEKDMNVALSHLLYDYMACDLEAKYDILDDRIFSLEHEIDISRNDSNRSLKITIPLFAEVDFGKSIWEFSKEYKDNYVTSKFNIQSKAPP